LPLSWRLFDSEGLIDPTQASRDEAAEAIHKIRACHDQGRQSLEELPERGRHGAGAVDAQAEELGWNATKLRKARQFDHRGEGYSRKQLDALGS
jgi:hypothetical protein